MNEIIKRIDKALDSSMEILKEFRSGSIKADDKGGGDPVTEADRAVDSHLKGTLPLAGEGWLSEETVDDLDRLQKNRVWIVDPLDGTREFVAGIPEWTVSIGFIEDGEAVAGGICNPTTGEKFLGGRGIGLQYCGHKAEVSRKQVLDSAIILASRSEIKRGEWEKFNNQPFVVRQMGSVAYKLALVAAGQVDATWTLVPKHEWDIAAGVALIEAAGGFARKLDGSVPQFNNRNTLLSGLWAGPKNLYDSIRTVLNPYLDIAKD